MEVGNDALANEVRGLNNLQDFLIVLFDQRKLELVLCRIDGNTTRAGSTIKTVDALSLDAGEVDRLLERANDAIVPMHISAQYSV